MVCPDVCRTFFCGASPQDRGRRLGDAAEHASGDTLFHVVVYLLSPVSGKRGEEGDRPFARVIFPGNTVKSYGSDPASAAPFFPVLEKRGRVAAERVLAASCTFHRTFRGRSPASYHDCQKNRGHILGLLRHFVRKGCDSSADSAFLPEKEPVSCRHIRLLCREFLVVAQLAESSAIGAPSCFHDRYRLGAAEEIPRDPSGRRVVCHNPAPCLQPPCHEPCCCRSLPLSSLLRAGVHRSSPGEPNPAAAETPGSPVASDPIAFRPAYIFPKSNLA